MKVRPRSVIQVAAPLVAIATLMLGLRVGAKDAVRAAVIMGAPLPRPLPGKPVTVAWQMVTFLDDLGVKETIPMRGLTVIGRAHGQEARWTGASNVDGIAEVSLTFDRLENGDPFTIEVRTEGDPVPLATGSVQWRDSSWQHEPHDGGVGGALRPTARGGAIGIDAVIEGGRLVPGFPTPLWIHVTTPPGVASGGVTITAKPEPGVLVDKETVETCEGGWALFPTTAQAHVIGSGFDAKAKSGAEGHWFGALPVAPGAFQVNVPRVVEEGKADLAVLVAPNPRNVAYAEVVDEVGRATAGALDVVVEPGDPTPRARFPLPPLAAGLHWLVVSGEPRGAEHLGGAAIAKPFLVGEVPGVDAKNPCSVGPWLAQKSAGTFGRWVALDGLPARSSQNRGRHRLGMAMGLVALLAAGLLEVLLLMAAARETRIAMQLAELDEGDPDANKVVAGTPGGSMVIALLLAVLGFALLAVLLVLKG